MSDLHLDIYEALRCARFEEMPYAIALNKRTNKQVIMPLSDLNGRYTLLCVCLSNGNWQEVKRIKEMENVLEKAIDRAI